MTARRIALPEGADRLHVAAGKAPELVWLPIASLVVEDDYQRPLGEKNWRQIRRIAQGFRWAHFSPCVTAPLDGDYHALIDGQHRAHAALLARIEAVPCVSVTLPDRADRARAFAEINGQVTAVTMWHVFRAEREAGAAWVAEADRAVEAAGCRIAPYLRPVADRAAGDVYLLTLVRTMVLQGRSDDLTRGLAALRRSHQGDDPWCWQGEVLAPLLKLMARRRDLTADQLAGFLSSIDLRRVDIGVENMRQTAGYAGQSRRSVLDQVLSAALDRHLAAGAA